MSEIIRVNNHDFTIPEIKAEMKRLYSEIEEKEKKIAELEKSVETYRQAANNLFKKEVR